MSLLCQSVRKATVEPPERQRYAFGQPRLNGFPLFSRFGFIAVKSENIDVGDDYGLAFLYTETDDNDLTHFIVYHLRVLHRSINQLYDYVERKTKQLQSLERRLRGMTVLNHRQRAIISHALRHPNYLYTIESHRFSHNVVYQTARTDLLHLADRGLFEKRKIGKEWHFNPVPDLEQRLDELY